MLRNKQTTRRRFLAQAIAASAGAIGRSLLRSRLRPGLGRERGAQQPDHDRHDRRRPPGAGLQPALLHQPTRLRGGGPLRCRPLAAGSDRGTDGILLRRKEEPLSQDPQLPALRRLPRGARPAGRRCGNDLDPRPLARAHVGAGDQGRQGRLLRETLDPQHRRRPSAQRFSYEAPAGVPHGQRVPLPAAVSSGRGTGAQRPRSASCTPSAPECPTVSAARSRRRRTWTCRCPRN